MCIDGDLKWLHPDPCEEDFSYHYILCEWFLSEGALLQTDQTYIINIGSMAVGSLVTVITLQ